MFRLSRMFRASPNVGLRRCTTIAKEKETIIVTEVGNMEVLAGKVAEPDPICNKVNGSKPVKPVDKVKEVAKKFKPEPEAISESHKSEVFVE
jgi:hypothetical protein